MPSGTQSGEVFRLEGKGMPRLRRRGHGDLYVQVQVVTPDSLDADRRSPRQSRSPAAKRASRRGIVEKRRTRCSQSSHAGVPLVPECPSYFASADESAASASTSSCSHARVVRIERRRVRLPASIVPQIGAVAGRFVDLCRDLVEFSHHVKQRTPRVSMSLAMSMSATCCCRYTSRAWG